MYVEYIWYIFFDAFKASLFFWNRSMVLYLTFLFSFLRFTFSNDVNLFVCHIKMRRLTDRLLTRSMKNFWHTRVQSIGLFKKVRKWCLFDNSCLSQTLKKLGRLSISKNEFTWSERYFIFHWRFVKKSDLWTIPITVYWGQDLAFFRHQPCVGSLELTLCFFSNHG